MANQTLCLKWDGFQDQERASFQELRNDTDFTDVTLACEDQNIKAHKVILSACSRQHCHLSICDYWLSWTNTSIRSQDPNNSSDTVPCLKQSGYPQNRMAEVQNLAVIDKKTLLKMRAELL